jgi:hypothetical protein
MTTATRLLALAAVGLTAACPLACASILGDFTASTTSSTDGGPANDAPLSADGNGRDAPSNGDSPGNTDGPADAGPKPLACSIPGTVVPQLLGTIGLNGGGGGGNANVELFNAGSPQHTQFRVVVPDRSLPNNFYHVYTFGQGGGGPPVTDVPLPAGFNPLAFVRYPSGIAALAYGSTSGAASMVVFTLDDMATSWAGPATVVSGAQAPQCPGNMSGALVVNDVATQDYSIVYSYIPCGDAGTTTIQAVHYTATAGGSPVTWPQPAVDSGTYGYQLSAFAANSSGAALFADPNGNGPPTGGTSTFIYLASSALNGQPTITNAALANPTDFLITASAAALPNGKVGLAMLEANLNAMNVQPDLFVGSVASVSLQNLVPSTALTDTKLAGIQNLIINGAHYHWESFANPMTDNLLAAGSVYPNANGINFQWWNGAGQTVAAQTSTNALMYFSGTGLAFYAADVTFTQPPAASLANFELVYVQKDPESANVGDVWASQIACVAQ